VKPKIQYWFFLAQIRRTDEGDAGQFGSCYLARKKKFSEQMTNLEFHGSILRKMLLLSQFSLERFGKMSAVFLRCLAFGVINLALLRPG
jgi:hypothetical protein